jgi:predicted enzyme involved in methoxymalonyl-ACP biosynthesis
MLLLSCRVLGRGVEHRLVARLGEIARERGLECLDLRFRSTGRNQPAHDFLQSIGAESRRLSPDEWSFRLSSHSAAALTYRPPQ